MAGQVSSIVAIGEVSGSRAVDLLSAGRPQREAGQLDRPVNAAGLRPGAPAGVVELSVDADAVRQLPPNLHLKFMVDPKDGRFVIQIIDSMTEEVLRVVPPSKLREALQHVR